MKRRAGAEAAATAAGERSDAAVGDGLTLDRTDSFPGVPKAGRTDERLERINEGGIGHVVSNGTPPASIGSA